MFGLDDAIIGAIAAPVLGGLANSLIGGQQRDRNEANSWDMYQTQRRDENDSIQRRANDMKQAGINPLLAAGNGAGTASGSSPTGVMPQIAPPDVIGTMTALSNIALTNAQAKKTQTETQILKPEETKAGVLDQGYQKIKSLIQNDKPENFAPVLTPVQKNPNKIGTGEDYTRKKWFTPQTNF